MWVKTIINYHLLVNTIILQEIRKFFLLNAKIKTSNQKERRYWNVKKRTKYNNKFKVKLVLEILKGKKTLSPYALHSLWETLNFKCPVEVHNKEYYELIIKQGKSVSKVDTCKKDCIKY